MTQELIISLYIWISAAVYSLFGVLKRGGRGQIKYYFTLSAFEI
jgi:hypothetical protein